MLDLLLEYERGSVFLSELISNVLMKYSYLEERDRAFIKALSEGCVENRIAIDYQIDLVSKTKTAKMKPVILQILRMAVCQILYMDHVPVSAVVNEAVKLTKKKHIQGLSGFVNGVSRSVAKKTEEGRITWPDAETEYSCPGWIAEKLREDYGQETALSMIQSLRDRPGLFLRMNSMKTVPEAFSSVMEKEGVKISKAPFPEGAYLAGEGYSPVHSKAFLDGLCSVQDISSQSAVKAAADFLFSKKNSGDIRVLDLCAAPGGKSCQAAELLMYEKEKGRLNDVSVFSFDLSENKLSRIRENAGRLGLSSIRIQRKDAGVFDPALEETADLLIADLPCSGLGVMNRKVDIKYRLQRPDIDALCKLQREILQNAVRYVKPGGILLYSVCTVTRQEGEEQVNWLTEHFALKELQRKQYLQGMDPCDGFFYALFERKS